MKHYKKITALIYGALLLICIGIVWLLGALNRQGGAENNRESTAQESTSQAGENQNGDGTPGTGKENGENGGNGTGSGEEFDEALRESWTTKVNWMAHNVAKDNRS